MGPRSIPARCQARGLGGSRSRGSLSAGRERSPAAPRRGSRVARARRNVPRGRAHATAEVREPPLCPTPRNADDLLREDRAARRHADHRKGAIAEALPVEPRRRGPGRGQPVQHHVVEQLVSGQDVLRVAVAVGPGPELLEDPRALARRRVDQPVAERLRSRRLLLGVAAYPHVWCSAKAASAACSPSVRLAVVRIDRRDDRHVQVDAARGGSGSWRPMRR